MKQPKKTSVVVIVTSLLMLSAAHAGEGDRQQKLANLLDQLKAKSTEAKQPTYAIELPVATAGSRGSEIRTGNRFAVLWPDVGISPITALVRNLDAQSKHKNWTAMSGQYDDFLTTFPEYRGEPLLRDLGMLLK
ncbi:MAG: hypothetical protein O3A51_12735 [Verrucomicrobia bacterium]|nr:hypothetical protein [Verrucomicrobiota bacterium]